MSVYKRTDPCEFEQAILSITQHQTYKPSQVVLVIDGEITLALFRKIKQIEENIPCVLTVVKLEKNSGLSVALNKGVEYCTNELIARMDDDDISLPNRLNLQYNYLCRHNDIHALGGQITGWSQDLSKCIFEKKIPIDFPSLCIFAQKRCPINHPTVMFRKSTILKVGGYPKLHPEDYLLWVKLILGGYKIENLPQVLVKMRVEKAIKNRRGMTFLYGELKLFRKLFSLGFISKRRYITNIICRIVLRALPPKARILLYKIFS